MQFNSATPNLQDDALFGDFKDLEDDKEGDSGCGDEDEEKSDAESSDEDEPYRRVEKEVSLNLNFYIYPTTLLQHGFKEMCFMIVVN